VNLVYLDEKDELVLRARVRGGVGRVRQQLVLGHHERVLEVVHLLERASRDGLHEPHALAGTVHHQVAGVVHREAPRDGGVADERGRQRALDGRGGRLLVGAALEDVEGLDERALRRVAVQPGERERAAGGGRRRRDQPLRHARHGATHGCGADLGVGGAGGRGARSHRLQGWWWLTWPGKQGYGRSGVLKVFFSLAFRKSWCGTTISSFWAWVMSRPESDCPPHDPKMKQPDSAALERLVSINNSSDISQFQIQWEGNQLVFLGRVF
jgi:hypothetical protein